MFEVEITTRIEGGKFFPLIRVTHGNGARITLYTRDDAHDDELAAYNEAKAMLARLVAITLGGFSNFDWRTMDPDAPPPQRAKPQTREEMQAELREIEGSYEREITKEKRLRAAELVKLLQACKCRQCGKGYAEGESRADYKGYCSQACLHKKAGSLGWRRSGVKRVYEVLKDAKQVGSVFVVQ